MNVNLREAFPVIASCALCRPQLSVPDFSVFLFLFKDKTVPKTAL